MTTKFTPGPWSREGRLVYALYRRDDGKEANKFSVHVSKDGGNASQQELEATAQLIQHAPELLEALKDIVDEANQCNGGKGARLPFVIHLKELAENAIRKAVGE